MALTNWVRAILFISEQMIYLIPNRLFMKIIHNIIYHNADSNIK